MTIKGTSSPFLISKDRLSVEERRGLELLEEGGMFLSKEERGGFLSSRRVDEMEIGSAM